MSTDSDEHTLPADPPMDGSEDPNVLGAAATIAVDSARAKRLRRLRAEAASIDRPELRPVEAVDPEESDDGGAEIVYVFEPHKASTPHVRSYIRSLYRRRRFIAELAKSDIKGRRSSTSLGAIWGLLDPVFQSAIYFFLFIVIRGAGGEGSTGRPVEFLPLLIAGVFLFSLTTAALNEGGKSVRKSTSLMLNSSFPRALLPIASVYKGLLTFVPTLFIYVVLYAFIGEDPQIGLLILPVLFAIQTVLSLGFALLMSTIVVFFADVQNMIRYIQRILFFTTPIIYPAAILPDEIRPWLAFQPLYSLFASFQEVLGGGTADPVLVMQAAAWAIGFLLLGGWVFLRYERAMAAKL